MSEKPYTARHILILKSLETTKSGLTTYATLKQIERYVINKAKDATDERLQKGFSIKTFQRDIKDIEIHRGVEIKYSKAEKGYFISDRSGQDANLQKMLDTFFESSLFRMMNKDVSKFIFLEKHKPKGAENLEKIIKAIKSKFQITFSYQNLWGETSGKITQRLVAPYALKEFKNRWYLLAQDLKDPKDTRVKSYGLDRLTYLEITDKSFEYPKDYDVSERFKDYFGIVNPLDMKPQKIVLLFEKTQSEYVKKLPLHHSQTVSEDNELQIELQMCVTFDFIQELLSFGSQVKVLEPQSLIDEIKTAYKDALKQYEETVKP